MEIERRSFLEYLFNDFSLNPNWERVCIIFLAQVLGMLMGFLFFPDLIMLTSMLPMIMAMFTCIHFPRKVLIYFSFIFLISSTFAVFTACIGSTSSLFNICFFLFWLVFFAFMSFKGELKRNIGLFTVFIYFMVVYLVLGDYFSNITSFSSLLSLSLYVSFVGFLSLFIGSIPSILLSFLNHDSVKNSLIASLFTNIDYDTFIDNASLILRVDSNPITTGLIDSSLHLRITRLNLTHIIKDLNKDYAYALQNEINNIEEYVSKSIKNNKVKDLEINLKKLKELNKNIKNISKDTTEYIQVKKITNTYINEYERINKIIKGEIVKEIPIFRKDNEKEKINLENINLRYIIRFTLATLISFIFDTLISNTLQYTGTITSIMAMNPKSNLTETKVLKRLIATILGVSLSILLGIILTQLNLSSLFIIPIMIGFALFYGLIFENYALAVFFSCFAFVLMKGENLFISQGLYRLISCAFACIVSFLIAKYLLPNKEEINFKELILEKITYLNKLIKTLPENNRTKELELINTNHNINKNLKYSIERVKESYKNIDEDLELILKLNESLKQIQHDTINLNYYLNKHKEDISVGKLTKSVNTFLTKIEKIIETNEDTDLNIKLQEVKKNIEKLEKELDEKEDKITLRITKWLIEDLELTYNIVIDSRKINTFEKLNTIL